VSKIVRFYLPARSRPLRALRRSCQLQGLAWVVSLALCACSSAGESAERGGAGDADAPARQGGATPAGPSGAAPSSLRPMSAFEELPRLRLQLQAAGASSASPTLDNKDHNHYWAEQDGAFVLFDEPGPAVINRFWHTGESKLLYEFLFDGEPEPRLRIAGSALWGAQTAPFVAPLTLDDERSSGGAVSYYPIGFEKSLLIRARPTGEQSLDFYNIGFTRYPDPGDVHTYTGREDMRDAVRAWSAAGDALLGSAPGELAADGGSELVAGVTYTLVELSGPRQISELRFELPALNDPEQAQAVAAQLQQIRLKMYWDGHAEPAVDAGFSDFFAGSGVAPARVRALPIGSENGRFYCFFPMPFEHSARIVLENRGERALPELRYRVVHRASEADFAELGAFHAQFNSVEATELGRDYDLLDVEGSGHYVGVNITFPEHGVTLEGNERVYVDGARSPAIRGTGTEDFFNGGWYFARGSFSTPTHGAQLDDEDGPETIAYRFNLSDPIPFRSAIRIAIQHGAASDNELPYRSVAYYYASDRVRLKQGAALRPADDSDAARHEYSAPGSERVSRTSRFYSDDPEHYTLEGVALVEPSQFRVAIDPDNRGLVLRQLTHADERVQRADVYVDDAWAGRFHAPRSDSALALWEQDLLIPERLTRGKTSLKVRVDPAEDAWDELGYQWFEITP
jgi:hypothetical protein